jgi:hypothetical protein
MAMSTFSQGSGAREPSKSTRSSSEPFFRRCCGRGCIRRANLLRLEKLAVTLLVGYALCDLLVFDLNATNRAAASAESTATPGSWSQQKPQRAGGCAFVRGVAVPSAAGPTRHWRQTHTVEDCCVACSDMESVHFYFDPVQAQCWCQPRTAPSSDPPASAPVAAPAAAPAGGGGARRTLGPRREASSGIISGEPSCCRALADARETNGTHYEDEFARNYDIGDLNDDGMMSEQVKAGEGFQSLRLDFSFISCTFVGLDSFSVATMMAL